MQWLTELVDEIVAAQPEGEVLIESGGSPSGTYHVGHLRELVIADAILLELKRRGRQARHIYFVDDLDALRKVPVNVPSDYEKYLGMSLCDIPAPEGQGSYAGYFLAGLKQAAKILNIDVEFVLSHPKYRSGFFTSAIERVLGHIDQARQALETISGRKLDDGWSPVQIKEGEYLKKRTFISIDTQTKNLTYLDNDGIQQVVSYADGLVKLDWRLDWPARWWQLGVSVEPFGRDHASSGGSYDTGVQLMKDVFEAPAPIPVPYDFINLAGDTKKMSASKGTGLDAEVAAMIMPAEVWRFMILKWPPSKRLYFDPVNGVVQIMDEYAALSAKPDKTVAEQHLLFVSTRGTDQKTVSQVPFSHLVASYQASLRDADRTLEVIRRTEHADVVNEQAEVIKKELVFIDKWLGAWAPEEIKFELLKKIEPDSFSAEEREYLSKLADKIASAPSDASGEWFHKAVYEFKDTLKLPPNQLFTTLYRALIGKSSGPRAGWFLSALPRDWLISRLRLES